jgi:regulatory protein
MEPDGSATRRRGGRVDRSTVIDPEVVMAAAARLLEARARSVDEVRRRLSAAGYPLALVRSVIDRLVELGVLDDEAFARAWLESRDRAHPRGERALRAELRAKGLDETLIGRVLAERRSIVPAGLAGTMEAAAADQVLLRRERALLQIDDPGKRRQRAWGLLARAGFDSDVAADATARAERRWPGTAADDAID